MSTAERSEMKFINDKRSFPLPTSTTRPPPPIARNLLHVRHDDHTTCRVYGRQHRRNTCWKTEDGAFQ